MEDRNGELLYRFWATGLRRGELCALRLEAWRMFTQIRKLMDEPGGPLQGAVRHGRYGAYAPVGD